MFEPINGLERLLVAAATDPAERAAFTKALLASELCISPTSSPGAEGPSAPVYAVALPSGELAAAIFTAPERVRQTCGSEAAVLTDTGRKLLEWLRAGSVVLNPGFDYGVVWSSDDLTQLLDGMVTETLAEPLEILLGFPAVPPVTLVARLTDAFAIEAAVRGAWLMLAHRSDEAEPTWMMGVDHVGDWRAVQAAIGRALDGLTLDKRLDVLDIAQKPEDTLRTGLALKAPPTPPPPKKRGLFGIFR